MYDIVLTGGRVVDPGQGIDPVTDVAFKDGRVAAVGDGLVTMSKFLSLGASLSDVIAAGTNRAAAAVGRPDLGTLKPGSPGDAVVLRHIEGEFEYLDSLGQSYIGEQKLEPEAMILNGGWWE